VKKILVQMTEKRAYQLRTKQKLTACIPLKIRYSDFNTYTMQCRLPYTAFDHLLIERVMILFDKLFQKRLLIRLVGLRMSHLVTGTYQYDLFDDMTEKVELYSAMDRLRKRFGEDAVLRASGMVEKKNIAIER
jgi:DNA polymerase-4